MIAAKMPLSKEALATRKPQDGTNSHTEMIM
jgi:hypothetical protein